ncbi:hypothetical protein AKJ16_DCAP26392 [Drosera capensis]
MLNRDGYVCIPWDCELLVASLHGCPHSSILSLVLIISVATSFGKLPTPNNQIALQDNECDPGSRNAQSRRDPILQLVFSHEERRNSDKQVDDGISSYDVNIRKKKKH